MLTSIINFLINNNGLHNNKQYAKLFRLKINLLFSYGDVNNHCRTILKLASVSRQILLLEWYKIMSNQQYNNIPVVDVTQRVHTDVQLGQLRRARSEANIVAARSFSWPTPYVLNNPFTMPQQNANWTQNNYFYWQQYHRDYGHLSSSCNNYYSNCMRLLNNSNVGNNNNNGRSKSLGTRSSLERKYSRDQKEKQLLATRVWERDESNNQPESTKPGLNFTVMSYNVLAQELLVQHPELYRQHNPNYLRWETRWKNLFNEIKSLLPDILCLQEVQRRHLDDYYARLETLGYNGLYKKRTGLRGDGCAIYYKKDTFNLIEYETVEYYQPNVTMLNRDNVALIVKLAPKVRPSREFVVATTHLLYNPKRQDVRLAQSQVFLTELERLSFVGGQGNTETYLPVILTGDLNSTPNSAVYSLIVNGELQYDQLASRSLEKCGNTKDKNGKTLIPPTLRITDSCQHANLLDKRDSNAVPNRTEELTLIQLHHSEKRVEKMEIDNEMYSHMFCSGTLSHRFDLKSVYNHGDGDNNEGTTYQDEWLTVDYIFYSNGQSKNRKSTDGSLKLISRYRLPRKKELGNINIPNKYLGSDHLALSAKFKLEF